MNSHGDNMIRTQISLEPHEYRALKVEAKALGISIAEFIRRAIRRGLPPPSTAPWMRYAGLVETGNPQSSQTIDEVVYGSKD
jgi:Ribbon-helix-helix protein, copG family